MKRAFYVVVAVVVVGVVAYLFSTGNRGDVLRVGGKKFTEGYVMAEMISLLLESRGIDVEERFDMGSGVVREALEHGQVDLYWEYTGTAYVMHQKRDDPAVMSDSGRVYDAVKALDAEQGLIWLERAPFNNTYTLMMTREKSEELGIGSISELAHYVQSHPTEVSLATNAEWFARPDGFQGLGKHYGFEFPLDKVVKMEAGLIYRALRDGVIEVAMGYSTDARIVALDLVNLVDDKAFFPAYNPAPVVRREVLEAHPELEALLNEISRRLDDATIMRLNYQADISHQSPEQVAKAWLAEQGLL